MRVIKFRGKHLCGQWYFGNLIVKEVDSPASETKQAYRCVCIGDIEDGSEEEVEENTIGQFTGLYDKNGKEIYEGDILKVYYLGKSKIFGVVKFQDCRFYIDDENREYISNPKVPMSVMFEKYEWEVVGNIYDTKTEEEK